MNDILQALAKLSPFFALAFSAGLVVYIAFRLRSIWHLNKIETSCTSDSSSADIESVPEPDRLRYYGYLREEIVREDEITNQRLTWSLTFQGFLINAMAFLLVFSWNTSAGMFYIRKLSLLAVGFIGLEIGLIAFAGILASRNSISAARAGWERRNGVWNLYPDYVPQTYGQGGTFGSGTSYTRYIPLVFVTSWCLFLIGYACSVSFFELSRCSSAPDVLRCWFDQRVVSEG